jgi:hypothetical protein
VSPSKTAIVPVNNTYLPRSCEERALVARTVFVGNIDRVVEREQLSEFFGNLCGESCKPWASNWTFASPRWLPSSLLVHRGGCVYATVPLSSLRAVHN